MRRLFVLCALLAACAADSPGLGEEGGECRVGPEACEEGLFCDNGECVETPDAGPTALQPDDLTVDFRLDKREVTGDGQDAVTVRFRVTKTGTEDPYVGDLLIRSNPLQAATPTPGVVTVNEGLGAARLQACHLRLDADCPTAFYVELAFVDRPTVVIVRSELVRVRPAGRREESDAGM